MSIFLVETGALALSAPQVVLYALLLLVFIAGAFTVLARQREKARRSSSSG